MFESLHYFSKIVDASGLLILIVVDASISLQAEVTLGVSSLLSCEDRLERAPTKGNRKPPTEGNRSTPTEGNRRTPPREVDMPI